MSKVVVNMTIDGSFRYEDSDEEVIISDFLNESDKYRDLFKNSGFKHIEQNVMLMRHIKEEVVVWELLLPYLDDYLTLYMYDDSKQDDVEFAFALDTNDNNLTPEQGEWILYHLMNAVIYQESFNLKDLTKKLVSNKQFTETLHITDY